MIDIGLTLRSIKQLVAVVVSILRLINGVSSPKSPVYVLRMNDGIVVNSNESVGELEGGKGRGDGPAHRKGSR